MEVLDEGHAGVGEVLRIHSNTYLQTNMSHLKRSDPADDRGIL